MLSLTAGCNAQYVAGKGDNMFRPGDRFLHSCDDVPEFDGDQPPADLNPKGFPVKLPAQEVGGVLKGALEPGERVEWTVDEAALNQMLIGGNDVCITIQALSTVTECLSMSSSLGTGSPTASLSWGWG